MSAPDAGALGQGSDVALQFVMRDMGNGVQRVEEVALVPLGCLCQARERAAAYVFEGVAPYLVMDLAETALVLLRDRALGYAISAPVRGLALFLAEGLTQITLKLAYVMGDVPAALLTMVG